MVATTVRSGSWATTDLARLADRVVRVVVDRDETGWRRGRVATTACREAGALVEPDALAPPEDYRDVTDAVMAGCRDLVPVDLSSPAPAPPGVEPEHTTFPLVTGDGRATFAIAPARVLLDARLSYRDRVVFCLLDLRAGPSGLARIGAPDIARALADTDRDSRAVHGSLDRLIDAGYVAREHRRAYRLLNPARAAAPAPERAKAER